VPNTAQLFFLGRS